MQGVALVNAGLGVWLLFYVNLSQRLYQFQCDRIVFFVVSYRYNRNVPVGIDQNFGRITGHVVFFRQFVTAFGQ